MNPLQSGTPSSSLAPQGYRNSTQSGTVQGTLNRSNVQQSNDDLLQAPVQGKLQVTTGGPSSAVLGASTGSNSSPTETTVSSSGSAFPSIALIVLIVSAAACVYFYRKFWQLSYSDIPNED
mgnify:CR=1 FL=1